MNFENQLHDMFSDIWNYEIDHPKYKTSVGELMDEVIKLYKKCAEEAKDAS